MLFEFLPVNCPFTLLAFDARIYGIIFSWYPKGLHQNKNMIEDLILECSTEIYFHWWYVGGAWLTESRHGMQNIVNYWDPGWKYHVGKRDGVLFFLGGVQDVMAFMDGTVLSTCKMNDLNAGYRIRKAWTIQCREAGCAFICRRDIDWWFRRNL